MEAIAMKPIRPASRHLRGLSRRDFLWSGSTGLATGLLSAGLVGLALKQSRGAEESGMNMQGHAAARSGGVPRAPYQKATPLIEPEVRRSVNGELRTTLQVRYAYKDIGGYRLSLRSYEGTIPGPTLRARPGDVLRIRLINDLPPNPDAMPLDMALPHHFNTTNFHFHGSHVSPAGISDNIFRSMEPGQSYDIEIAVPRDHTKGTYWYHPHHHGSAFHIHTNPFQMVAINGEKLAERDWRDTVVVPRNGSVTFRSRFLDFSGRFVLHCHMMNHEELGMMQVVEVYAS
jgi:FtsP/CotA-like multicopper oxidase with cupredoxin domain